MRPRPTSTSGGTRGRCGGSTSAVRRMLPSSPVEWPMHWRCSTPWQTQVLLEWILHVASTCMTTCFTIPKGTAQSEKELREMHVWKHEHDLHLTAFFLSHTLFPLSISRLCYPPPPSVKWTLPRGTGTAAEVPSVEYLGWEGGGEYSTLTFTSRLSCN